MSAGFDEEFYDAEHACALDGHGCEDFPFEEVYRRLGEARAECSKRDYDALTKALKSILTWMSDTDLQSPQALTGIGRRVLAFMWVLNPDYFEGQSLTKIAALIGLHKASLSPHAADASRNFDIRNRGQAHAWNFKKGKGKRATRS
jgi:hypothetical protein